MGVEARHSSVLDAIGMQIADGTWQAGHVLTLESIQDEYGVSRTVARETMRVLESMGLVISRRRVGITVRPLSEWNVFDPRVIWWRLSGPGRDAQLRSLTELRIAVEPLAAGAAARGASAADRDRIGVLAVAMRASGEAGDLETFLEQDIELHGLLLRASGNEMFMALEDVVAVVLRGRTHLGLMPHQPVPKALDLHEEVARRVATGQPEAAETAMRELLSEVRAAVVPYGC